MLHNIKPTTMKKQIKFNEKTWKQLAKVLRKSQPEVINEVGIAQSTWYSILNRPSDISVKNLLKVSNRLHIPVRRFFSTGSTEVIGRREDYILEPYAECDYNGGRLRSIILSRCISWQEVARVVEMDRNRVRDSIMSMSTPVSRLILICNTYDIDLFEVLIDPNPDIKIKKARKAPLPETAVMQREIQELCRTVEKLQQEVSTLQEEYKALAYRVSVNIDTFNNSHLSIAAEPEPEYLPQKKHAQD